MCGRLVPVPRVCDSKPVQERLRARRVRHRETSVLDFAGHAEARNKAARAPPIALPNAGPARPERRDPDRPLRDHHSHLRVAQPTETTPMKKTLILTTSAAVLATTPPARAVLGVGDIVSAPIAEEALIQKNFFDQLKYAWEQAQWAEKLATLSNTLSTVQEHLETANQVKQAIGDPVAAIALIDNGLFSGYLEESGIADSLGELASIASEGAELSATVQQLFEPINLDSWMYLSEDAKRTFDGVASLRNGDDPLKRFRAVESAFSRYEILLGRAQNKRKVLNRQIAKLNTQLKGAEDDAEVQKLVGSLAAAQTALDDIDYLTEAAAGQVQTLHVLNQNRSEAEEVAAEQISRERNRDLAQLAAEAEAELQLPEWGEPDLTQVNPDLPPGF